LAIDVGDTEGYDKALELLDKHNDKYPGFEIKPAQLKQSIKAFQKRSQEMLGGVYLEKGLRPYLSDIIGP
jgi:hypothetical protein